jgi:hypothetical protein
MSKKKQEVKEVQAQQQYLSSQAYRLFSKGKPRVQMGIELNLRQSYLLQVSSVNI